jgi:hypothetical protein
VLFLIALVSRSSFCLRRGASRVVGAIVLDLVEVGVDLWWNRRRKATVGIELLMASPASRLASYGRSVRSG